MTRSGRISFRVVSFVSHGCCWRKCLQWQSNWKTLTLSCVCSLIWTRFKSAEFEEKMYNSLAANFHCPLYLRCKKILFFLFFVSSSKSAVRGKFFFFFFAFHSSCWRAFQLVPAIIIFFQGKFSHVHCGEIAEGRGSSSATDRQDPSNDNNKRQFLIDTSISLQSSKTFTATKV